jgi:hypothetical protein
MTPEEFWKSIEPTIEDDIVVLKKMYPELDAEDITNAFIGVYHLMIERYGVRPLQEEDK